ncbi:hypothetical protein, partial [Klebsiella pneumoniae]
MGSCAAPSAKGDDKFITTDYLQQCPPWGDFPAVVRNGDLKDLSKEPEYEAAKHGDHKAMS